MNRRIFMWGTAAGVGVLGTAGLLKLKLAPKTTEGWPPRLVALIRKVEAHPGPGEIASFPAMVEEYQSLPKDALSLHGFCVSQALGIHHHGYTPVLSGFARNLTHEYASLPRDEAVFHWLAAFVTRKGGFAQAAPYMENPNVNWNFLIT